MKRLLLLGALALACVFSITGASFAQVAADASTKVDLGPLLANVVYPLAAAVVTVLAAWVSKKLATRLGLANDAAWSGKLEVAMQNGLAFAQSKLNANVGSLTIDTKNQLVAVAANYAIAHVPQAMKALGVDQTTLVEKLQARLEINTTPAAESVAVPTTPEAVRT